MEAVETPPRNPPPIFFDEKVPETCAFGFFASAQARSGIMALLESTQLRVIDSDPREVIVFVIGASEVMENLKQHGNHLAKKTKEACILGSV